jgi:hypothetical protein
MTYLSAAFLRHLHPHGTILLLSDIDSAEAIKKSNHEVCAIINKIIAVRTPEGSQIWKSRYLKTHMREMISGDFLFLDIDTIPVKPLDQIFDCQESVAVAQNHSTDLRTNFDFFEKDIYDKLNWPHPKKNFVNTGVIFWKDNSAAHRLSDIYIQQWSDIVTAGYHYDQPAFNRALEILDQPYQILDNRYNAQFRPNILAGIDASLWHFYASDYSESIPDYYSDGLAMISKDKRLSHSFISRVCKARIPFITTSKQKERRLIFLINQKGSKVNYKDYELSQKSGLSFWYSYFNSRFHF